MNQENQVSLKEFNMLAGSIASVWYAHYMKGYYLPHLSSSAMTSEYLLEIMRGEVFRIEKKNIQKCTLLEKSSKVDLYAKLKELILKKLLPNLGFKVGNLPNKDSLNLMDQVFLKPNIEDVGLLAKEDLEQFLHAKQIAQQLDTTLLLTKKPGFLKRTEEQRIAIAEEKSQQKLQRLKQKVDKKDLIQCILLSLLTNMKNNLKRRKQLNNIKLKLDATIQCRYNFALIKFRPVVQLLAFFSSYSCSNFTTFCQPKRLPAQMLNEQIKPCTQNIYLNSLKLIMSSNAKNQGL